MEIRRPAQDDPIQRFIALLDRARGMPQIVEPTAMTLATVGADGRPSARVVLLKGVDEDGLVFYTNLDSRKGKEALAQREVALVFWWAPLESQIRFEGRAERVSDEEADAYFATRPRGSQLGAWASAQSEPIGSRAELEGKLADVTEKF
ncbi:MAG TPA: pyridoxal 5'-phosphate synthase, partial [Myxococcales bacterium]|nr:pyridoxal 5'-phosphate synthase [Myxococcales bacterium]